MPALLLALCLSAFPTGTARASIAYGTVNNFDTVNDTGVPCHGFEIELDDCSTAAITYTFDYNHYGTPKITQQAVQDGLLVWHTNTFVRYEAVWTNTNWSAFTAVPSGPIPPTAGHAFTNPGTNFGGEHFGVGYRANPSKVYYHWLVDNGSHSLVLGPQVSVSTPVFTYTPAVGAAAAQMVAVIPAPVLPLPPSPPDAAYEFSDATWVKEIRTTSHTNREVRIGDLMTPDLNNSKAKDWRNGEPDEVEVEWQLLQTDFMSSDYNPTNKVGGANGKLAGAGQALNHGDDVVTRRYEYYAYVGPYADLDTHEALAQSVAADGKHGTSTYSNTVVVGKFLGAQMSSMSASPPIGLIDHLPDGQLGMAYPTRSLVIASDTNFVATGSGALPVGMAFERATGLVYGSPSQAGVFVFTVTVTASNNPVLVKTYPFLIGTGAIPAPHCAVDTAVAPLGSGTASGSGVYTNGVRATVTATPGPGYTFASWTENGTVVSSDSSYSFTNVVNRSLLANFAPQLNLAGAPANALRLSWLTNASGYVLQQSTNLQNTNWSNAVEPVGVVGGSYQATIAPTNKFRFFRLHQP